MEAVNILVEALPYIKEFYNKKVLIKYGGHAMVNEQAMSSTARDTVLLKYVGMEPIVVHGGGPEISRAMDKFGKEPEFIQGLRVTDEETMEIVKMVLLGKVSTRIVSKVCLHGGKAVGISGKDAEFIHAKKKSMEVVKDNNKLEIDLGLVGEIESLNPEIIQMLTDNDYIPIISPIGADERGCTLNLNADTVAGELGAVLGAEKLIILTDVPGILEDPNDPDTLIKRLKVDEIPELIENGVISGGMIPKTLTCVNAINKGVTSAHIIDGRVKHSLLLEIFTDYGIGTMITK